MKRKSTLIPLLVGFLTLCATGAQALPILVSQGLPATQYAVSSFNAGRPATNAFDGNLLSTNWLASSAVLPQWIKVDLGAEYYLNEILLYVNSIPTGNLETHEIWYSSVDPNFAVDDLATVAGAQLLGTTTGTYSTYSGTAQIAVFGSTDPGNVIQWTHVANDIMARYVEIKTTAEASGVRASWKEVQLFSNGEASVPEPSTLMLVVLGLAGAVALKRRV